MPQHQYSRKQADVTKHNKRITLPIPLVDYNELKEDAGAFRQGLDEMIEEYPELFPAAIEKGYTLRDVLPASRKLPQVQLRRIRLKAASASGKAQVYTIASSGVLPYMVGLTDEIEKALFLRRFGVPFWALSYVFGRDDSYWYRLCTSFGRNDLVSTTIKSALTAGRPAHHHLPAPEQEDFEDSARLAAARSAPGERLPIPRQLKWAKQINGKFAHKHPG